jgi:ribonucleoside-diphosphate reductase alpha chain
MKFDSYFVPEGKGPYFDIVWEKRNSVLKNASGETLFFQDTVIVPSSWSQIASDILAQKYFRKTGVPENFESVWFDYLTLLDYNNGFDCLENVTGTNKYNEGDITFSGGEYDARQVFHRLARTWVEQGRRDNLFSEEKDAGVFYKEVLYMLSHQMAAPNSPQWFNTGLYDVYGIAGEPQNHYYYNDKTNELVKSTGAYKRPQTSACYILPVEDDLVNKNGIYDTILNEARIFKYGSGAGSNFSNIRGKDELLSGGGKSSGLLSFLKINDRSASAIKSGGTTRRAALMCILDIDHPDIEEFIEWKAKEEHKVASLATGSSIIIKHLNNIYKTYVAELKYCKKGDTPTLKNEKIVAAIAEALDEGVPPTYIYQCLSKIKQTGELALPEQFSVSWGDESYETVSGQSVNNSVRVTDDFMRAVKDDRNWTLVGRVDKKAMKVVKARDLWNKIIKSAWECADPGVQFHDTINRWNTTPAAGTIRASNPCSEFMAIDGTVCNLASINLIKFYSSHKTNQNQDKYIFDINGYIHAINIWTVILDMSTSMAQYPSALIAKNSYKYRFSGLGYAGLGSLLMRMGIPYDSYKGRTIARGVSAILTGAAYRASAAISKELGPFSEYDNNKEAMLKIIDRHTTESEDNVVIAGFDMDNRPGSIDDFGRALKENEKMRTVWLDNFIITLKNKAKTIWKEAKEIGESHGFRNAQVTCIAPTGTIGLLMDCDTTGIEPEFALVKYKKLSGGGSFKMANQSISIALNNLGYKEEEIIKIMEYVVGTRKLSQKLLAWLYDKGFTEKEIELVEKAFENATDFNGAFNKRVLGEKFIKEKLKIDPNKNILEQLGIDKDYATEEENRICGRMNIEGAPRLKEKDYAVFDTAALCGKHGKRCIPYMAHIYMMASVQPTISGGISKTINMPANATFSDIENAYKISWYMGLKSITIYRDKSKLSQPLSSFSEAITDDIEEAIKEAENIKPSASVKSSGCLAALFKPMMDNAPPSSKTIPPAIIKRREKLPSKRKGYIQKVKIAGHSLFLHTGEYENGKLGEIFIDMHREGAAFRSLLNCFAISVSLGIQYGVPLDEYVDAFVFSKFEPNGMIQDHKYIKTASSVIDYIFRDLAINYLGRHDLAQVLPVSIATSTDMASNGVKEIEESNEITPEELVKEENTKVLQSLASSSDSKDYANTFNDKADRGPIDVETLDEIEWSNSLLSAISKEARRKGYEGDPCPTCGAFTLVRSGTCMKCVTCGNTTGCS